MLTPEGVRTEIEDDPMSIGYAGKTLAEQYQLLSSPSRTRQIDADMKEVFNFIIKTNVWDKLDAATSNEQVPEAMRRKIRKFLVTIGGPLNVLNFSSSDIVNNLPLLQQFGIISGFEAEAFLSLAQESCSRSEELWGQSIGIGYFARIMWPEKFIEVEQALYAKQVEVQDLQNRLSLLQEGIDEVQN